MRSVFVQLNPDGTQVINYFGECFDPTGDPMVCPQDPKVWPNQAAVASNDPRYVAFYDTWPAWQQFYITPGT